MTKISEKSVLTDEETLKEVVDCLQENISIKTQSDCQRVWSKVVSHDQKRRGERRRGDAANSNFPRVSVSPCPRVSLNQEPTGFDGCNYK